MHCADVRAHLLGYQAGRLDPALHEAVQAHLEVCRACAHEDAAEHALTDALESRLPQHPAPLALKRRLAVTWPAPAAAPARRWRRPLGCFRAPRGCFRAPLGRFRAPLGAAAVGVAVVLATVVLVQRPWSPAPDTSAVIAEAVNDHVSVVERRGALPVTSQVIHQVKPWFTGQIDFAPVVPFAGDADFPLRGGSVERFLDRKAAVLVYGRRLHTISLLVFRADGLPWPREERARQTATVRGFNVVLWRARDLGYALVSDVDARDLADLGTRLGAD